MVHQASETADIPMSRQTPPALRYQSGAAEAAGPTGGILGISPALLLALFMGSMFIPAEFHIAGVRLTPYTSLLIVFILPMFLYFLRDRTNRVITLDLLIVAYVLWTAVAVLYNNGPSRIIFVFNQTVSYIGGYMIGRVLIRRSTDYELFFRCFFYALLFFLPFAVVELVTERMIISEIFATFSEVLPRAGNDPRLGLHRVQAFLEHAITYGLFCSIGVANLYYIYRGQRFKQMSRTGLAAFMTFISLSSAPNIALGLQILLIAWDRMLARVRYKWVMLIIIAAVVLSVLQLSAPRGIVGLVDRKSGLRPPHRLGPHRDPPVRRRRGAAPSAVRPRPGRRLGPALVAQPRRWTISGWRPRCASACRRCCCSGSASACTRRGSWRGAASPTRWRACAPAMSSPGSG